LKLSSKELLKLLREAAEEKKAYDVKIIEVSALTTLTDYFMICTSDSNVQSRAIADNIADRLEENGLAINSREGYQNGEWVVMDTRKVIVHIFTPEIREHYNLERFWEEEVEDIQKGASDNLSHLIKTRKTQPARKSRKAAGEKKAASAKTTDRKKAAGKREEKTAVKGKTALKAKPAAKPMREAAKKPLSKKEEIEREILRKAKPAPKKNILTKEKPAEKSRKQLIEEEIIKMRQKREENRVKQLAHNKSKQSSEFRPGGKNEAKKMREATSFASKAKSKAGSMAAIKGKKGVKK